MDILLQGNGFTVDGKGNQCTLVICCRIRLDRIGVVLINHQTPTYITVGSIRPLICLQEIIGVLITGEGRSKAVKAKYHLRIQCDLIAGMVRHGDIDEIHTIIFRDMGNILHFDTTLSSTDSNLKVFIGVVQCHRIEVNTNEFHLEYHIRRQIALRIIHNEVQHKILGYNMYRIPLHGLGRNCNGGCHFINRELTAGQRIIIGLALQQIVVSNIYDCLIARFVRISNREIMLVALIELLSNPMGITGIRPGSQEVAFLTIELYLNILALKIRLFDGHSELQIIIEVTNVSNIQIVVTLLVVDGDLRSSLVDNEEKSISFLLAGQGGIIRSPCITSQILHLSRIGISTILVVSHGNCVFHVIRGFPIADLHTGVHSGVIHKGIGHIHIKVQVLNFDGNGLIRLEVVSIQSRSILLFKRNLRSFLIHRKVLHVGNGVANVVNSSDGQGNLVGFLSIDHRNRNDDIGIVSTGSVVLLFARHNGTVGVSQGPLDILNAGVVFIENTVVDLKDEVEALVEEFQIPLIGSRTDRLLPIGQVVSHFNGRQSRVRRIQRSGTATVNGDLIIDLTLVGTGVIDHHGHRNIIGHRIGVKALQGVTGQVDDRQIQCEHIGIIRGDRVGHIGKAQGAIRIDCAILNPAVSTGNAVIQSQVLVPCLEVDLHSLGILRCCYSTAAIGRRLQNHINNITVFIETDHVIAEAQRCSGSGAIHDQRISGIGPHVAADGKTSQLVSILNGQVVLSLTDVVAGIVIDGQSHALNHCGIHNSIFVPILIRFTLLTVVLKHQIHSFLTVLILDHQLCITDTGFISVAQEQELILNGELEGHITIVVVNTVMSLDKLLTGLHLLLNGDHRSLSIHCNGIARILNNTVIAICKAFGGGRLIGGTVDHIDLQVSQYLTVADLDGLCDFLIFTQLRAKFQSHIGPGFVLHSGIFQAVLDPNVATVSTQIDITNGDIDLYGFGVVIHTVHGVGRIVVTGEFHLQGRRSLIDGEMKNPIEQLTLQRGIIRIPCITGQILGLHCKGVIAILSELQNSLPCVVPQILPSVILNTVNVNITVFNSSVEGQVRYLDGEGLVIVEELVVLNISIGRLDLHSGLQGVQNEYLFIGNGITHMVDCLDPQLNSVTFNGSAIFGENGHSKLAFCIIRQVVLLFNSIVPVGEGPVHFTQTGMLVEDLDVKLKGLVVDLFAILRFDMILIGRNLDGG